MLENEVGDAFEITDSPQADAHWADVPSVGTRLLNSSWPLSINMSHPSYPPGTRHQGLGFLLHPSPCTTSVSLSVHRAIYGAVRHLGSLTSSVLMTPTSTPPPGTPAHPVGVRTICVWNWNEPACSVTPPSALPARSLLPPLRRPAAFLPIVICSPFQPLFSHAPSLWEPPFDFLQHPVSVLNTPALSPFWYPILSTRQNPVLGIIPTDDLL